VRSPERRGKEHAQGLAIGEATGDLLVFSDAGTDLPPDSIGFIVDFVTQVSVRSRAKISLSVQTGSWRGRAHTSNMRCGCVDLSPSAVAWLD
jgi:hypothetical protein